MVNTSEKTGESPLFNIDTGKSVKSETENFLLNIDIIRDRERNKFIDECRKRPERFEKRIKRQKLSTFTTEAGKKRITSKMGRFQHQTLCVTSLTVFWKLLLKSE